MAFERKSNTVAGEPEASKYLRNGYPEEEGSQRLEKWAGLEAEVHEHRENGLHRENEKSQAVRKNIEILKFACKWMDQKKKHPE